MARALRRAHNRVDLPQPVRQSVPTPAVLVHHLRSPSASFGSVNQASLRRRRMPRRSGAAAKAGLSAAISSISLAARASKYCDLPADGAGVCRLIPTISIRHFVCSSRRHGWNQALRLRPHQRRADSTLLFRPDDPRRRLDDHNAGRCPHTVRYRPWRLQVVIEFPDEPRAVRFERYLKSGSGRAFAKRHFEQ